MFSISAISGKATYLYLFLMLSVVALVPTLAVAMETLNVDALVNTDSMFANANKLIAALGALVLVIVGFKLAILVIRFVINIFDSFRFS